MRFPQFTAFQFLFSIAVVGISGLDAAAVDGSETIKTSLVIKQHTAPDGSQFFAIAAKPTSMSFDRVRRHLVLVDTSASQTGQVRESSLKLVSQIVAGLSADSQLQILAVDVDCESMTDGFVNTASRDVNAAIQKLSLRTPLGATNLKSAFRQILATGDQQPTSVVYIGDGLTTRDVVLSEELESIVQQFAQKRISVHSLVLGPQTDATLPAILANLTGGTTTEVLPGRETVIAENVAAALTVAPKAIHNIIVDGKSIDVARQRQFLLRPDRHTLILGEGRISDFRRIHATTESGESVQWDASASKQTAAGAELKHLVRQLAASNGLNAPVASLEQLNRMGEQFATSMDQTIDAIEFLQRRGRNREAQAYLKQAVSMDAGSQRLKTILTGFGQPPQNAAAPAPAADELIPAPAADTVPASTTIVDDQPVAPAPAGSQFPAAQQEDPLTEVETVIQLQTQILVAETDNAIDEASRLSFDQPEYAASLLKDALETIRSSSDISADIRSQLANRVRNALSGIQNQKDVNELKQRQIAQDEAVKEAQAAALQEDKLEEERLAILIEQVRGLLDRGRHGDRDGFEDGEAVSRTALDLRPGNGPATQSLVMSEALGQLDKAYRLVNLRHDRFLEVLYQVELSHVPFPDEPPIQYPPADVWRVLTLTRKPRYEAFDLRIEAPVEKWLRQMLDKPIPPLDFPGDTPLSEILETIQSFYTTTYGAGGGASGTDFRMTIYPDLAELDLEGITSLEEVSVTNISFEGMKLRNALDLIFEQTKDPELTYIIENEVFKITTLAKAESEDNLVTRVYPVGDLVIPPMQLGGGGQQGGGGFGGGQQGGGGFGGGQGGGGFGGGGGGQGGFGGGGGGFMSIAPELLDQMKDAANNGISTKAVRQLKKKPELN